MKRFVIAVACAALAVPALALAQTTITDKPGIVGTDGKKVTLANGRICQSRVKLGSRLPTAKVCKTKAEWDKEAANAKEQLEDIQAMGGARNCILGSKGECIQQ